MLLDEVRRAIAHEQRSAVPRDLARHIRFLSTDQDWAAFVVFCKQCGVKLPNVRLERRTRGKAK